MIFDAIRATRAELKKKEKRDLLRLRCEGNGKWCNIGACECRFFIQYGGFGFCLTELLGQGCCPKLEPGDQLEDKEG